MLALLDMDHVTKDEPPTGTARVMEGRQEYTTLRGAQRKLVWGSGQRCE